MMKKRALGLTDIAIPSVPYERTGISDDNYEKSIIFFGKNTLDSGNPNSIPNINQVFEKEPEENKKEKRMKKKRFLKLKSLKKMASSSEKDQKTIEALKSNFLELDKKFKESFKAKKAKASIERKLSLYKRGGKIWSFIYKIAQSKDLTSVFSKIEAYFTENIDKIAPKISLFQKNGKIDYVNIFASNTRDSFIAIEYLYEKIFYNERFIREDGSTDTIPPEESARVKQKTSKIIKEIKIGKL